MENNQVTGLTLRAMDWAGYQEQPIPVAFWDRLAMRSDRWRAVCAGLHLMSVTGWNLTRELAEAMAAFKGAQSDSGSMRRVFQEYMPENGLVVYDGALPYLTPHMLSAVRLTDFGKDVCRACGWEPVESGWERLIRLHEGDRQPDHTAAVLAFAREARLRGYRADILPEVKEGNAVPDLYVKDRLRRRAYVEVETTYHRLKPEKWRNLVALQGYVAVAAKLPSQRQRLVKEIKRLRLPGWATDLETLRANAKTDDPYFLFIERWDENGRNIELPRSGKGA